MGRVRSKGRGTSSEEGSGSILAVPPDAATMQGRPAPTAAKAPLAQVSLLRAGTSAEACAIVTGVATSVENEVGSGTGGNPIPL